MLANILMTEVENVVMKKFVDDGTIKFYGRYVDDTLILMKPTDIKLVHDSVNHFDKNLRFAVDTFEYVVPHFLDLGSVMMVLVFIKKQQILRYMSISLVM